MSPSRDDVIPSWDDVIPERDVVIPERDVVIPERDDVIPDFTGLPARLPTGDDVVLPTAMTGSVRRRGSAGVTPNAVAAAADATAAGVFPPRLVGLAEAVLGSGEAAFASIATGLSSHWRAAPSGPGPLANTRRESSPRDGSGGYIWGRVGWGAGGAGMGTGAGFLVEPRGDFLEDCERSEGLAGDGVGVR